MSRRPAVRASNARDAFDFWRRTYPRLYKHLLDVLPPDVIERVSRGVRTDWLPIEIDGPYVEAIFQHFGPEDGKRAYRRFFAEDLMRGPLMRSFFDGVMRVFGVTVGGLVRVAPHGLAQSYRDAFDVSLTRGDREALLVLDDIAPELLRFPYPMVWEAIFLGIYDLAKTEPALDFKLSRAQRRCEARFHW